MHVFFWQMTWAMINQSLQTQGGETSDFRPPFQPFLQRDFANVEATWSLANKGRKVQKEGHVHLLLMGLKIFYLGKVTARQE